MNNSQRQ